MLRKQFYDLNVKLFNSTEKRPEVDVIGITTPTYTFDKEKRIFKRSVDLDSIEDKSAYPEDLNKNDINEY